MDGRTTEDRDGIRNGASMIDLTPPQALLNRTARRAEIRARFQIASSVTAAVILVALAIAGYGMLLHVTAALPALLAEAAARSAG